MTDYPMCWNCGQPGIRSACVVACPACDVTWSAVRGHDITAVTQVAFMGQVFPAVDFTLPGALSCPA